MCWAYPEEDLVNHARKLEIKVTNQFSHCPSHPTADARLDYIRLSCLVMDLFSKYSVDSKCN